MAAAIKLRYRLPGRTPVQAALAGPPGTPTPEFTVTQSSPSASWIVNHNLGFHPLVTILTPGFVEMEAQITHTSNNQLLVGFASPQTGSVRCI